MGGRGHSASRRGDGVNRINRDHQQQHQQIHNGGGNNFDSGSQPPVIRRNAKSGDVVRNNSGSHPSSQRRSSEGDHARDTSGDINNWNSNNHNKSNQGWTEEDLAFKPRHRLSQDSATAVTEVHRNTRRAEPFVSDMRDSNKMASAPPTEVGGRLRGSDTAGGNTSRIIAERKRRSTGNSADDKPNRRDPLSASDRVRRPRRRATANADSQPNRSFFRRVNTAGAELERTGNHNFEPQKLQPTGPKRRISIGGDLRAVAENKTFTNSNVSDIHDDFNESSFNRGNPNRRRTGGTASDKSNEHTYPSGVGGRRRTTRSDGGRSSSRRQSRSISAGRDSYRNGNNPQSASDVDLTGGDIQEELHQLRLEHHRNKQLQQQSSNGRRRSSMTNSEQSYDLDDGGMATFSAPLGGRLSNYEQDPNNPNQEMGGFLREAAYEANKSEHSWYMGKDASRSSRHSSIHTTRHSTDEAVGTSRHSTAPKVVVSAIPSVRTNDQRMFNDLLRGFTPGGRRKSDDLLIGFAPRRRGRKLRWYERHSLSKRTILIAMGLVFLAMAMLGAVLLLSERGIGFGSGNNESVGNEKNFVGPGVDVKYVKPPPSDIDGRCSSSNLPGSLPACLEACYPASCCYGDSDSGAKCLDANDSETIKACKRYRPYCDIFHDTWDGATDGVLRTPRADLVPICQQVNGKNEEQSSKLRARNLLSRNLLVGTVGTAEVICEQYCEAAKCCAIDPVLHPYSANLELSASGVYTDASTKEYVVTNCQDDLVYQKNKDLCAEYDKFCVWEDVEGAEKKDAWTSRPTMDPASTMMPSTSPSIPPSASPSMTLRPTPISQQPSHAPTINVFTIQWITKRPIPSPSITPSNSISPSQKFKPSSEPSLSSMPTIPRANITSVEAACAGADNVALLADGNEAARTKCLDACLDGLCCYTEQLGYSSFIESCYDVNEAVCEEYSACLWLKQSGELTLDSANETTSTDAILNSTFFSNGTIIMNANVTSLNSSILINETSTTNNTFTSLNTSIVFYGTSVPSLNPSSVSNEKAAIIFNGTQYSSSTTPVDESSSVNITSITNSANSDFSNSSTPTILIAIPPPPSDIAALCALGQGRFCTEICADVSCCFEETPELNCYSGNTEICQGYAPCSVLYPQGS